MACPYCFPDDEIGLLFRFCIQKTCISQEIFTYVLSILQNRSVVGDVTPLVDSWS